MTFIKMGIKKAPIDIFLHLDATREIRFYCSKSQEAQR